MEQAVECLRSETWHNNMTPTTPQLPASRSCQQDTPNLKINRSQPVLRRRRCCLLSLLLTVCCSASSSSKRSHSFTSVLCFTLASMKHLCCHSYDLHVCISKVSAGCKQATNAQQTTTDRRTDVRHKWSRRSRRQLSESVKAPWLSLIGTNKERFSHLEWSVLAFEMLLNLSVSQGRHTCTNLSKTKQRADKDD